MLFDLRGRGRRRAVQVIYLSLAILMGGGLVFFGIGGGTDGGLDAFSGQKQSVSDVQKKELTAAEGAVRADRQSAAAWQRLARVRFLQAQGTGFDQDQGVFTDQGKAHLAEADRAWQEALRLTKKPDPNIAALMVQAYGPGGLAQPKDAVAAFEFVLAARQPTSEMYMQYAALAYQAGQMQKGDLAGQRAVALAPKLQRDNVKQQVAQLKQSVLQQQIQQAQQQSGSGGTTTTPAAPATP